MILLDYTEFIKKVSMRFFKDRKLPIDRHVEQCFP